MEVLSIILSSLALLAVIVNSALTIKERKRSQKRNTAQVNYVDESVRPLAEQLDKLVGRVESLEKGVIPDFEKAKAAANAVNEFNTGITGILGYDPYAALRRARDEGDGGEGT